MERVGFIGVGMMGGAVAARMIENGVPVLAYDVNPDVLSKMQERGASIATSVKDVVDQVEIVFACLPTPSICRNVALGEGGVIEGNKIKTYIEISSLGGEVIIDISDALKEKSIDVIDCPVVGGVMGLEAGTLGSLAAGPKAAFESAKYALESFSGRLFHLGEEQGMGQAGKVVNNLIAYTSILATCEAVSVGMKAGLDMATTIEIINQGSGANFFSEKVFPNYMMKGKYDGTGAIEIGLKDVTLFMQEAKHLDVPTPVADMISELQKTIIDSGEAGRDTMTYFHYFTDLAGLPRQD